MTVTTDTLSTTAAERLPSWAWSSVDDPNPYYPTCDQCDAFARWSVGEWEHPDIRGDGSWVIRHFACGRHLSHVLTESGSSEWMVYDITFEPERP